jgi:hypothetical protein
MQSTCYTSNMQPTKPPALPCSYEDKLAEKVSICLTQRTRSTDARPLLALLGCPTLKQKSGGRGKWSLSIPQEPPSEHETLVADTLFEALKSHMSTYERSLPDGISILCGLCLNDRWRRLLAKPDGPYYLTTVLIDATMGSVTPALGMLRAKASQGVAKLLNDWCAPAVPFEDIPTTYDLVRTLFSPAWCDIVLDANAQSFSDVRMFIWNERPAFMPGLIPGQPGETTAMLLPDISED